jgi:hypothetical protein
MEPGAVLTLGAWMKQVQSFKAGAPGYAVVALTLIATAYFAFNPEIFFGPRRYPRIVMTLPALAIGAAVFVAASAATWLMRRSRP